MSKTKKEMKAFLVEEDFIKENGLWFAPLDHNKEWPLLGIREAYAAALKASKLVSFSFGDVVKFPK